MRKEISKKKPEWQRTERGKAHQRGLGAELLMEGKKRPDEIARELNVSERTVRAWARRIREGESLKQIGRVKAKKGRPPLLTADDWRAVMRHIAGTYMMTRHAPPSLRAARHTRRRRWTLREVRDYVGQTYGVWYHERYVYHKIRKYKQKQMHK